MVKVLLIRYHLTMDEQVPTYLVMFTFVLLLAMGIFFGLTIKSLASLKLSSLTSYDQVLGITPLTREPVSLTFNLTSPEDNLLSFEPQILIQGKTNSNLSVFISTDTFNQVVSSGTTGSFSATVKLQKGVNLLVVGVFDGSGNKKLERRSIYYSEEKI